MQDIVEFILFLLQHTFLGDMISLTLHQVGNDLLLYHRVVGLSIDTIDNLLLQLDQFTADSLIFEKFLYQFHFLRIDVMPDLWM